MGEHRENTGRIPGEYWVNGGRILGQSKKHCSRKLSIIQNDTDMGYIYWSRRILGITGHLDHTCTYCSKQRVRHSNICLTASKGN